MKEDKELFPTTLRSDGVKRFFPRPEKEVPWPTKVFYCVGWAVDKLITVLLVLVWPLIFLCTWTTGCYLDVRTRTWKELCTDLLARPQYMDDVDDWIFLVILTLVVDVVGAGALFLLCAAACWLWQYKIALAIGVCVLLVTAFFWFCHGIYKLLKED